MEKWDLAYYTGKILYAKWGLKGDWVNLGILSLISTRLEKLHIENPELFNEIMNCEDKQKSAELLAKNIYDYHGMVFN